MVLHPDFGAVTCRILVASVVTHGLNAHVEQTFAQIVIEAEIEGETIHRTGAGSGLLVVETAVIVGIGQGALNGGGHVARHNHKVRSDAPVGPSIVGHRLVFDLVVKTETEEVEFGAVLRGQRDFAIKIQEPEGKALVAHIGVEEAGGLVQIGALARQNETERGFPVIFQFDQRTFQEHLALDVAEVDFAGDVLFIAIARFNVHHGRDTPAKLGPEATGIDIGAAHNVHIKHREDADGVERAIEDDAVEQEHILDGRAAAHINLAALVAGGDDARQHLQILGKVGLTADGGHLAHILGRDTDDGGACFLLAPLSLTHNLHRLQHRGRGLQGVTFGDRGIFAEFYRINDVGITHIGDLHGIGALRNLVDHKRTFGVGERTIRSTHQLDGTIRQGGTTLVIVGKSF